MAHKAQNGSSRNSCVSSSWKRSSDLTGQSTNQTDSRMKFSNFGSSKQSFTFNDKGSKVPIGTYEYKNGAKTAHGQYSEMVEVLKVRDDQITKL